VPNFITIPLKMTEP